MWSNTSNKRCCRKIPWYEESRLGAKWHWYIKGPSSPEKKFLKPTWLGVKPCQQNFDLILLVGYLLQLFDKKSSYLQKWSFLFPQRSWQWWGSSNGLCKPWLVMFLFVLCMKTFCWPITCYSSFIGVVKVVVSGPAKPKACHCTGRSIF